MLCWFDVISSQVVTVKCSGRELKVGGLPSLYRYVQASCRVRRHSHLQCNMWRQASQDVHQYHEKCCACEKERQCGKMTTEANIIIRPDADGLHVGRGRAPERHRLVAPILRASSRNSWRNLRARTFLALFLRGQLLARDRHGRNV